MRITGMGIGFVDCEPKDAQEYNLWYDRTMGPENAALPEMIDARRYVAPPDYQKLRGPTEMEGTAPGRATYVHMYLFGSEDIASCQKAMGNIARKLGEEDRLFSMVFARYQGPHRLVGALTRTDLPISRDAIPHLGHVAIHFSIGEVTDKTQLEQVEEWYEQIHLPDIVETPGFLAALRLLPIGTERWPAKEGRFMNIFLLNEQPAKALAAFRDRVPELRDQGRLASPGKSVRLLYGGPYQPIVPLEYDFL